MWPLDRGGVACRPNHILKKGVLRCVDVSVLYTLISSQFDVSRRLRNVASHVQELLKMLVGYDVMFVLSPKSDKGIEYRWTFT